MRMGGTCFFQSSVPGGRLVGLCSIGCFGSDTPVLWYRQKATGCKARALSKPVHVQPAGLAWSLSFLVIHFLLHPLSTL